MVSSAAVDKCSRSNTAIKKPRCAKRSTHSHCWCCSSRYGDVLSCWLVSFAPGWSCAHV